MNDFDYDVKEKKRIAQGARYKKRPKKGCTLPSDYLTPAKLKKMNGEIMQIRMNAPMGWDEFNRIPEDLQIQYLKIMRERYLATDTMIGMMFGRSSETVRQLRMRLNVVEDCGFRKLSSEQKKKNMAKWEEFIKGNVKVGDDVAENEEPVIEVIDEESVEEKPKKKGLMSGFECNYELDSVMTWDEVMEELKMYPFPKGAKIQIHVSMGEVS